MPANLFQIEAKIVFIFCNRIQTADGAFVDDVDSVLGYANPATKFWPTLLTQREIEICTWGETNNYADHFGLNTFFECCVHWDAYTFFTIFYVLKM